MKKLFSLLLSLFILTSAYPAGKSVSYPSEGVLSFKGLDDTSTDLTVQDGRASAIQNVKLDRSLKLIKRRGYSLVNTILNEKVISGEQFPSIVGLYYTKISDGTALRLVISGTKLYKDVTGVWTAVGGTNITHANNNQFVWITALDNIIFTNDVDVPYKYTGTGDASPLDVSDLTDTLTKVKALAWFNNFLILGNTVEAGSEKPTRFRWSNIGTIETFSDDDFIDIAQLGGQEILGFAELGGNLFAFLTDSIYKISFVAGDEVFVTNKVIDDIGCIAKNSIRSINLLNQRKGVLFLSNDKKVYFFDGTSIVEMSTLITTTMSGLNVSRLANAVAAVDGSNYYLSVSDGTGSTNDLLLVFQYEIGEWTKYVQVDANAIARIIDSSENIQIYFGNYDSCVFQLENTSNDSDVTGQTDGIDRYVLSSFDFADGTATSVTFIQTDNSVFYDATGAIISITSGTGAGQEKVIVNQSSTGLVIDSDFTTAPDTNSIFTIGIIDASYTTKWYDLGEPARNKRMSNIYLWSEVESGTDVTISQFVDFGSMLNSQTTDLTGSGAVWGTAIWGTDTWGGQDALFQTIRLVDRGKHIKLKFSNSEIDEHFELLGFNFIYWREDLK